MTPVGIDLGYGEVKVVPSSPGRPARFPSAWVPYTAGAETWGIGAAAAKPLVFNGQPIIVGDAAANRPGVRRPFGDGRLADPEALPLLAAALWRAGAEGDVVLGSGLPLSYFATERQAARQALEGKTLHLGDGRRTRSVHIAQVVLRPQGVGAALYLAREGRLPNGPGLGVVVDIGTRTTDVLTLVLATLAPVVELSFSLELGVNTAANSLARQVGQETGRPLPPDLAAVALLLPVAWAGKQVGGATAAQAHRGALADTVRAEIARHIADDLSQQVGAFALVGGGAVLVGDFLRELFPGQQVAVGEREAAFANALGFHLAAERVAAKAAKTAAMRVG